MVVWMQFIIAKYFEDCCLGQSQFSCNITWASPQLFCHSRSCGIFIGWCPYILWVTWIHNCNSCRALPVVWRYCCYCWNIAACRWCHPWKKSVYCCAPVPAKLLLAPSVKGTSQYSWCVYSVIIGYSWALLCYVWLKNYLSQDIYNILNLFFNKESHSGEHVHKFSFTQCTWKRKYEWSKETRPIILEGVTLEVLMKGEVV